MDGRREELLQQLRPLEDLQRPRLHGGGARLMVRAGFTLDNPGVHTMARQFHRGEKAGWPSADDQYLCPGRVPHKSPLDRDAGDQVRCVWLA